MVEKRFGALRFVSGLFKVLAWIILIAGIIGGIVFSIITLTNSGTLTGITILTSIGIFVGAVILSLIWFVILKATSEIFIVLVAIEFNTRETAYLMRGEQQQGGMAPPPMR